VTLQRNNAVLNPFTQRFADAVNVYLSSDWDSGIGWNAGVLFRANETWRVGLSYRSGMDIDLKGDATFTQIPIDPRLDPLVRAGIPPNQGIRTTIPFPATTVAGIATTAVPGWDIEADVTYVTWSRFETLLVEFDRTRGIDLHRPENWKNTMSYRIGGNRRINDDWSIRLGAVYDENPQPTESVGPILPDSDRTGVSFGIGFHRGPWIVDVTDFVLHFLDRSTEGRSADNLNGTYRTDANLVSVNFGYRF
ncbi:MAG TPA: outer membrane protein transport protein, partial [Thermoanaerobaculia bacterium]|nr:outer membrane protein transport protein [Thermoanaerobaculia bacterium]